MQPVSEHSQSMGWDGDGRGHGAGRTPESLRAVGWRRRKGRVSLKLVNPASDLAQHSRMGFIILLITVLIILVNVTIIPVFCVSLRTGLEVLLG